MNLQSCFNPVRLRVNGEFRYFPCGKCEACQQVRNFSWKVRLERECQFWPYTVFFTLTYNEECLPVAHKISDNDGYFFVGETRRSRTAGNLHIASSSEIRSCLKSDESVSDFNEWLSQHDSIPYADITDIQLFLKRLRKNLKDETRKYKELTPECRRFRNLSTSIRYYIISEYGPTHGRPHYHGLLWFSSELLSTRYAEMLSKAWQYGFVNCSFTFGKSVDYVTKYVNSSVNLPPIYRHKSFRPFRTFSKFPPIGAFDFNAEEFKQIYDRLSVEKVLSSTDGTSNRVTELWPFYKNRIFPRLSLFSSLSHSERLSYYSVYRKFAEQEDPWYCFLRWLESECVNYPIWNHYARYAGILMSESKYDDVGDKHAPVYRWFMISARVCSQASALGVSLNDYVRHIEDFYSKLDKSRLKKQLTYEQERSLSFGSAQWLIGLDRSFVDRIMNIPSRYVNDKDALLVESYGIPPDLFFACEPSERGERYQYLHPEHSVEFLAYKSDKLRMWRESQKVRKKNDSDGMFK